MQQKQTLKIFHTFTLWDFALKTNLANLKTEVDQLDIDKLAPAPVNLSKLSDVVKNDVVKNCMINWLQKWIILILGDFVLKAKYNTDKTGLENKTHWIRIQNSSCK